MSKTTLQSQEEQLDYERIGGQFVELNRRLNAADTPETWEPAVRDMHLFLDRLEPALQTEEPENGWSKSLSAKVISILLTVMAEAGQYRHETYMGDPARRRLIDTELLPAMRGLRQKAVRLARKYFSRRVFAPLRRDLEAEIYPLLDSMAPADGFDPTDPRQAPERYMPFRVIQAGNIAERLYALRWRTTDPYLKGTDSEPGLLQEIYSRKYLRFGTSGVRGRWGMDFTAARARQVVQAICDFLNDNAVPSYAGAEKVSGKRIVVGYDSRRNAEEVARWVAAVCLANGFTVDLANRDTPTPALVYYLTDYLPADEVAGLINCTASHNPPEWQGIKFNPRLGYPAPTNTTDFIAARINELQLLDTPIDMADLEAAEAQGRLRGFDPISHYTAWILNSGRNNARLPLDWERIRRYFADKLVVVDEMHGAGRGYLTRLLGEIGVRHTVLHAERNPNLPGLDYANPEEPFIEELKRAVATLGAAVGLGLDTDADRFGIVDRGGIYFRPNQILPLLIKYVGVERGWTGRVIATQTGSPLIDGLAGQIAGNEANRPEEGAIPAYVNHPYYLLRIGQRAALTSKNAFLVPVGIKYIEEQRRTDRAYRPARPLPPNWRDTILIGGEESSGLTTRGHVTDKDGIWADLLILDMLAYYGERAGGRPVTIAELWKQLTESAGFWNTYGGLEAEGSNSARADVDAVLEAKEELIDYYLGLEQDRVTEPPGAIAGLEVIYAGGIRYDIAELRLRDRNGDDRHFLRIRASGTEPINRIYIESSDPEAARRLRAAALQKLEELSIRQIEQAHSEWHLVDMLTATQYTPALHAVVEKVIAGRPGWSRATIAGCLAQIMPTLERRSQRIAGEWFKALQTA